MKIVPTSSQLPGAPTEAQPPSAVFHCPAPLRVSRFWGRAFRVSSAFSLVEVLLAVFILGIGLIMVASVFPVGANWTRQTTEDSNAQAIALNALTVIQAHYDVNKSPALLNPNINATYPTDTVNTVLLGTNTNPFLLQCLPRFTQAIPLAERSYQFGNATPFPAPNPQACTYFWTALCRLNPIHNDGAGGVIHSSSYKYDLYILVFRKGLAQQQFNPAIEVFGVRDPATEPFVPCLFQAVPDKGSDALPGQTPSVINAVPPIGNLGIGVVSGTVFRQGYDSLTNRAIPRPMISVFGINPEQIIYSPPADGDSVSPLVYIYQTSITQ